MVTTSYGDQRQRYMRIIIAAMREKLNDGYEVVPNPNASYFHPLEAFLRSLGYFDPSVVSVVADPGVVNRLTTSPTRQRVTAKSTTNTTAQKNWATIQARSTLHSWAGDGEEIYSLCSKCKLSRANAIHQGGSPPATPAIESQRSDASERPSSPPVSNPLSPMSLPPIERRQRTIRFE